MNKSLLEQFYKCVRENELIKSGDNILVALSGGPDSTFLLHILLELRKSLGIKEIYAAHINHNIRKKESDRDENFVKEMCEDKKVHLFVERANFPDNKSVNEELARKVRYSMLENIAKGLGNVKIALGHTATDNAETVILNLLRGGGIKALSGIPVKRSSIIRPLLYISKNDIEAYLKRKGIDYVLDTSNKSDTFKRNFIRNRISPMLAQVNPAYEHNILKNSIIMREYDNFFKEQSKIIEMHSIKYSDNNLILFDRLRLLDYHKSLLLYFLKDKFGKNFQEVESLYSVIKNGGKLELGEQHVEASFRDVVVYRKIPHFKSVTFESTGLFIAEEINMEINITKKCNSPDNSFIYDIAADALPLNMRVRNDGDRVLLKDGKKKKLKKIFMENKIPAWRRSIWPVFEHEGTIILVPGLYRLKTRGDLTLEIKRHECKKFWIFDN